MIDKLCVSERRLRLIDLLIANSQMTIKELAQEFNVTLDTISRDILFLSSHIPLFTKAEAGGGVFILKGYKSYSYYFNNREKEVMLSLLECVLEEDKDVFRGIIAKHVKNYTVQSDKY